MKILCVSSGNSKNGINPIIKSQCESFQGKDIEIQYFSIMGKGIKNYFIYTLKLRKHLKDNKYDLIHAHYGFCGIVAQLARFNEKLIVSFMGTDLMGTLNSAGERTMFGKLFIILNKIFLKKYDFIITKSAKLKKIINFNEHTKVIPNGVDFNKFKYIEKDSARKNLNISHDKRIIIFVANPDREEKNYKLAASAIILLHMENLELLTLQSEDQEKLNLYYNAADLLLLTSYHEGSPNVIKEAMACNCPIVSTDVGDVHWVLGETDGCYITSYDQKDVAEKIKYALNFSEKVGRTKGRKRIIELGLDSETIAKKIITIYYNTLNS